MPYLFVDLKAYCLSRYLLLIGTTLRNIYVICTHEMPYLVADGSAISSNGIAYFTALRTLTFFTYANLGFSFAVYAVYKCTHCRVYFLRLHHECIQVAM